jgi:hypothetical protein
MKAKKLKYTVFVLSAIFTISGCNKTGNFSVQQNKSSNNLFTASTVPASFTQKTLIEDFSGDWCGYCPNGIVALDTIEASFPDLAYGVDMPQPPDSLSSVYSDSLSAKYKAKAFPAGCINRIYNNKTPTYTAANNTGWNAYADSIFKKTAACGLAINSVLSGRNLTLQVHCGFNKKLTQALQITAYLTETDLKANQANYLFHSPVVAGTIFYRTNGTVDGYVYKDIFRQLISKNDGDAIPATDVKKGGEFIDSLSFTIPSAYKTAHCFIIAFIKNAGNGQILNVQRVQVGTTKNYD